MLINNCDATYLGANFQTLMFVVFQPQLKETTKDSGSQRCKLEKPAIRKDDKINVQIP